MNTAHCLPQQAQHGKAVSILPKSLSCDASYDSENYISNFSTGFLLSGNNKPARRIDRHQSDFPSAPFCAVCCGTGSPYFFLKLFKLIILSSYVKSVSLKPENCICKGTV